MMTETKSPVPRRQALHLADFTIESLGVKYPDYFQGYGLGPSSEYTGCCNGIGNTEFEALEDCLEQLAQSGSIDLDDGTEKRIREEYGRADDNVTALDETGCSVANEYPDGNCPDCGDSLSDVSFGDNCADCGKEFEYPEYVPYWHIGIKWNIREEQRIERIQNLPDIQPLRYENYTPLHPSDRYKGMKKWGYARRADGSVSYGDFKETDWPESVEAYLGALCEDIEKTEELYFYVPYASGSDYSGSIVEKANAKCIEDSYEEQDWVHPVCGDYNTYAVAIGVTGLLTCDEDTFDELCETLEGLANYPLIDEDVHSELEMEGANEAWDSWCASDFTRALEKEYEDRAEFEWPDDSALYEFFVAQCEKANVYWYCEGSGPGMYIDLDAVVKKTTFDDIVKWAIRYEVSYCAPRRGN